MVSDIVERLRIVRDTGCDGWIKEACNTITALRAKVAELERELMASDASLKESRANDMESMRQLTEAQAKIEAAGKQEPVAVVKWRKIKTPLRKMKRGDVFVIDDESPSYLDGVQSQYSVAIADGDGDYKTIAYVFDKDKAEIFARAFTAPPITTAGEPYAWRLIETPPLTVPFKRFMTQEQYEAQGPNVKRCYEPFRCANCTTATRGTEKEG